MALHGQPFVLSCALFAEMLFNFLAALDFGQVDGGVLIAVITFHRRRPQRNVSTSVKIVFPSVRNVKRITGRRQETEDRSRHEGCRAWNSFCLLTPVFCLLI